eukprot:TRINITY_DN13529_c0_g1_i1.p1 TRINITY_DN13529_c0_g1~~TRINITY_DN13529_c0_g1_i1.p1  ORF type:complete len:249 (-),score=45.18 TRINITY_DN13529_c0_g1_i1:59-805(-)
MNDHGEAFSKLIVDASHCSFDSNGVSLSNVIEVALERAVICPLRDRLMRVARARVKENEQLLSRNMKLLRGKDQGYWGVKPPHRSPSDWSMAVLELYQLRNAEIPSEQLTVILDTARAIYDTYNTDKSVGDRRQDVFLSADDFLPIFIYVIVRSEMEDLETTAELMWSLCDPEKLTGEGGYYLTVFGSALHFVRDTKVGNAAPDPSYRPRSMLVSGVEGLASPGHRASHGSSWQEKRDAYNLRLLDDM